MCVHAVTIYSGIHTCYVCTGFERKEKSYRNLPEALLHWRVALEVVSIYVTLQLCQNNAYWG